jgi:hypothetical protein
MFIFCFEEYIPVKGRKLKMSSLKETALYLISRRETITFPQHGAREQAVASLMGGFLMGSKCTNKRHSGFQHHMMEFFY